MDARVQMKKYFYVDKKGYVFRSLARYDSDVKGSRPEKIYLGKICDDDRYYFVPNKRYFELYPEEKGKDTLPIQADSIAFGNFALLKEVIGKLHLYECMTYAFSVSDDDTVEGEDEAKTELALDLACYMINEESCKCQVENAGL